MTTEPVLSQQPIRSVPHSGLRFPAISLGLWQNFGASAASEDATALITTALDLGVFHLDLANNYGPPPGAAESFVGTLLRGSLRAHRDEMLLATKAGYRMWPGPYGEGGSRKYLLSSLDASLSRLGTDVVDIFYSHRYDPTTPLEETIGALATALAQGKAHYVGVSSYSPQRTREALAIARDYGIPLSVHQSSYSLVNRWIEEPDAQGDSVLSLSNDHDFGVVAFSPLAQGLLTDKYLNHVPSDSRAALSSSFRPEYLSEENLRRVRELDSIAQELGLSLAQMAVAWILRDPRVSSVLVGARTPAQFRELLHATEAPVLTPEVLTRIDQWATDAGINLWAQRSSSL